MSGCLLCVQAVGRTVCFRPGHVQPRLLSLLKNKMMLRVNQQYAGFAGDRIWSAPVGREIWAKPLPTKHEVAVLLFNRNGTTSDCSVRDSIDCPCDDDPSAAQGAQDMTLDFDLMLPRGWILEGSTPSGVTGVLSCDVSDIFGGVNASAAVPLGRSDGRFEAKAVPPHGSRFLLVGNCTMK